MNSLLERTRLLLKGSVNKTGPVVYWMSRDQRADDNWALIQALQFSSEKKVPCLVVYTLVPEYPGATQRAYDFMLQGLEETAERLSALHIPMVVLTGDPVSTLDAFLDDCDCCVLVTDFDPLKIKRSWKEKLLEQIRIPVYETDAHNIVPCTLVSDKREFGAYTLRPKITRILSRFLEEIPVIRPQERHFSNFPAINWTELRKEIQGDRQVLPVKAIIPGSKEAREQLNRFIRTGLGSYEELHNDPNAGACSGLSPYLHFGQIAPQRVTLEILKQVPRSPSTDAFLEELIVRRELSDNFCYYNTHYDSVQGFPEWAKKEHALHWNDQRDYTYTLRTFELANTHDPLWNAAQSEMMKTGKMHGYLRMYWAKKILEWSSSPDEAMSIAIFLNDKYQLDGRDPNGYTGIAWSIGGVHDRAWSSRPVYGKIRYMNESGCRRKFNVDAYIRHIQKLSLS